MNNPPDATQLALINALIPKLVADPKNETIRTGIFQNQVQLTSKQLGITQTQAASAVRSYTAAYAYSKGQDPKAVLDALTSAQQQILNYDKNKPTLYGMDLVTANKFASYFAAAAGPVLFLSLAAFIVALFIIGPEAAAAIAGAGGVVEAITAVLGVSASSYGGVALLAGSFLFLVSQFLGHFANFIPMATKQMVDNGTIAASLQITAIKNVAEVQAQLTGTKAPGPYSSAQFQALYNGLKAAGINSIKNPTDGTVQPFSQQALASLINYIYGTQIIGGAPATPSKITPMLQPWLFKGVAPAQLFQSFYDLVNNASAPVVAATPITATPVVVKTSQATSVATPKIFTGVVSQGVLSSASDFTPRPDDLITSVGDLETAAANNLAPFLAALPGKIIYEIKIVASVTTQSGFTQRGTSQRVQSGTYANGSPKYKTVTNKFAVMNLYILNKSGTRTSLAQIVLGPTDAVQFQPGDSDLATVQSFLQSGVPTSNVSEITSVAPATPQQDAIAVLATPITPGATSPAPIQVTTTADQLANRLNPIPFTVQYPTNGLFVAVGDFGSTLYERVGGTIYSLNLIGQAFTQLLGTGGNAGGQALRAVTWIQQNFGININTLPAFNMADLQNDRTVTNRQDFAYTGPNPSTNDALLAYVKAFLAIGGNVIAGSTSVTLNNSPQQAPISTQSPAAGNTQTLSAYYASLGQSLPDLATRASLYASLGLGQASFYTGTAEQNTKLLAALQQKGVASSSQTTQVTIDRFEVIYDPAKGWSVDDKLNGTTKYYPDQISAEAGAPDGTITIDRYEVIYDPAKGWSVDDTLTGDTKYYASQAAAEAAAK